MKRAIQEVKDTKGSSEVVIEEEQTTQCPKVVPFALVF
jgi:hypothetical protein